MLDIKSIAENLAKLAKEKNVNEIREVAEQAIKQMAEEYNGDMLVPAAQAAMEGDFNQRTNEDLEYTLKMAIAGLNGIAGGAASPVVNVLYYLRVIMVAAAVQIVRTDALSEIAEAGSDLDDEDEEYEAAEAPPSLTAAEKELLLSVVEYLTLPGLDDTARCAGEVSIFIDEHVLFPYDLKESLGYFHM